MSNAIKAVKKEVYNEKMEAFQDKYGALMLDGLNSSGSYIQLLQDEGLHVAARPYANRTGDTVIFAVKLRVAYDGLKETGPEDEDKYDERVDRLLNYTAIPTHCWANADARRVSTLFGKAFQAPSGSAEEFSAQHNGADLAKEVYEHLEEATGLKFSDKMKVINALTEFFNIQIQYLFDFESIPIEETQVSNVLNLVKVLEASLDEVEEAEEVGE